MIPDAYIRHRTDHRLRIIIPSKKKDHEYFRTLHQHLSGKQGIETIEVNPLTGSVLIAHNLDADALVAEAQASSLFALKRPVPDQPTLHKTVKKHFKGFDDRINGLTGGYHNISTLAFLGFAGIGIYQIARGNFTAPAWYTAFWYALNLFLKSDPERGTAAAAAADAAAVVVADME
jgi:hypothetical protein